MAGGLRCGTFVKRIRASGRTIERILEHGQIDVIVENWPKVTNE
jgi:hypothetical protein